MHELIQTTVNGVTTGMLYALIALGYTMVYGILKLLNFAHGDIYMVGAYIGYFVIQWFGGPTSLVIPMSRFSSQSCSCSRRLARGVLGVLMERFAYRPLRNAPRIAPLITALGLSFIIENSVLLLFGGFVRSYSTPSFISFSTGIHVGALDVDAVQITVILGSVLMMAGLKMLVDRTTLGKSMRAVAADRHIHQAQRDECTHPSFAHPNECAIHQADAPGLLLVVRSEAQPAVRSGAAIAGRGLGSRGTAVARCADVGRRILGGRSGGNARPGCATRLGGGRRSVVRLGDRVGCVVGVAGDGGCRGRGLGA